MATKTKAIEMTADERLADKAVVGEATRVPCVDASSCQPRLDAKVSPGHDTTLGKSLTRQVKTRSWLHDVRNCPRGTLLIAAAMAESIAKGGIQRVIDSSEISASRRAALRKKLRDSPESFNSD